MTDWHDRLINTEDEQTDRLIKLMQFCYYPVVEGAQSQDAGGGFFPVSCTNDYDCQNGEKCHSIYYLCVPDGSV